MEKIFSARLDEAVLDELDRVTRRLGMTKKQFLQEAIRMRAQQLSDEESMDIWTETLGAWDRREKPETTIRKTREKFTQSFKRHHRGKHARLHR
jgi:antitoxin component of RelBE/YafQ-DinJ toxin-antitoxin module